MNQGDSSQCPDWFSWDLELSPHLIKRMADRDFDEVDLRVMLETPHDIRPDVEIGRWLITSRLHQDEWHVIVEPDHAVQSLVVVTAYRLA